MANEVIFCVHINGVSCHRIVFFWAVTQPVVIIPYRALKMRQIGFAETSVWDYHYRPLNSPEEHSAQILRIGSVVSFSVILHLYL